MIRIFFLILMLSTYILSAYNYNLSIAVITKDEDKYLKEWIDYHINMGVDHFYLYDNNDDDKTAKALQAYIKEGIVELIPWPNLWKDKLFSLGCQTYAYNDALKRARRNTRWLAFIDTDEFLVPMKENTLTDVLKNHYSGHGFIYVNWLMFGTSDAFVEPGKPLLPHLTRCAPKSDSANIYGKTICRPELTNYVEGPHYVNTKYPYLNGSGKFHVRGTHASDLIRINHYVFRDENFLRDIKIPRLAKRLNYEINKAEALYRCGNSIYNQEIDLRILELIGKD